MEKNETTGVRCIEESQSQWLQELRRNAIQCRMKWKTTLFQAEAVFLSLSVPIALGNEISKPTRFGILLSSLMSMISLYAGLRSLKAEALQSENTEAAERNRILASGPLSDGIRTQPGVEEPSKAWTALFQVHFALALLAMYCALGGAFDLLGRLIHR